MSTTYVFLSLYSFWKYFILCRSAHRHWTSHHIIIIPCVCNCFYAGECTGEFSNQMAGPKQMQCSFNGVYPEAIINWFHYDKNLTSNSTTTSLANSDGTFNITSVLNIQDDQKRYNCSLWSLKYGRYSDQEFEVPDHARFGLSSRISTLHCLSWTIILFSLMFSSRACLSL